MENIEIIGTFSPGIILIILYYYYYKISVTVISSDKKILNLVVNDYLYQKYKIHKDKIHYRCSKAKSGHVKCKSTVMTHGETVGVPSPHSPKCLRISENQKISINLNEVSFFFIIHFFKLDLEC